MRRILERLTVAVVAQAADPSTAGPLAGVAFVIATATGMVTAATALVKIILERRQAKAAPPPPPPEETVDAAQARIVREALENMADADLRAERAEAEARDWRDRYIRLLEGERDA